MQACKTLPVDLIVLDLSKRWLPFSMRRALVLAAVKRGVTFELVYSPLLDDAAKQNFLQNARSRD